MRKHLVQGSIHPQPLIDSHAKALLVLKLGFENVVARGGSSNRTQPDGE